MFFHIKRKKKRKKFCSFKIMQYLCTRNSEMLPQLSWLEHLTVNQGVLGSSPRGSARIVKHLREIASAFFFSSISPHLRKLIYSLYQVEPIAWFHMDGFAVPFHKFIVVKENITKGGLTAFVVLEYMLSAFFICFIFLRPY